MSQSDDVTSHLLLDSSPTSYSYSELSILALGGIGEVKPGDQVAEILAEAVQAQGQDGDVLVVTQKIVSKAEGRLVAIESEETKIALVEHEAARILRRRGPLLITETHHGFVCANSGVDLSNIDEGFAALLPIDPDRSARRIRADLKRLCGIDLGVIISDTFGRPWRVGVTDIAIGCAGIRAILDLRGGRDAHGNELVATEICLVDEIAGAGELVMGKDRQIPAALIRGLPQEWLGDFESSVQKDVVRDANEDLFR